MFVLPPKPTLLVIEKSRVIAQHLAAAVKGKRGFSADIISARTAEGGLKEARERKPDLIFLDWMLPPLHGEEFLAEQSRIPEIASIPVLVYSALEGRALSDLREFYPVVKAIIPKPLSSSKLFEAMRPYLKTGDLPPGDEPPRQG
jgi:two-component system phosphate regulon response regulator PhoB